jgi:Zn-dependent protease with chaperone function
VRPDTANRSFFGLLGAAFVAYQLVGLGACVLLSLIAYEVATDGVGAVTSDGGELVPAVLFLALVGVGAVLGVRSVVVQAVLSVRLERRIRGLLLPTPPQLADAAHRARLGRRIALIDVDEPLSFAYGAFTPKVAVSRGLLETVSPAELDAVLEHERYHVRSLDPLKVLMARAIPDALFYLPALRGLHARYIAGRELAADRRAVRACGRDPLARALLKVLGGPGWPELRAAAAIGGPDLVDVRVTQLETGKEPRVGRVSKSMLALSVLGAALLTASVVASLVSSGGLSAVMRTTMPQMDPGALGLVGMLACALPWLLVGWLLYRWLSWRAARP